MENKYMELINTVEEKYQGRTAQILEDYKSSVTNENMNKYTEEARREEVEFFKQDTISQLSRLKERYIKDALNQLENLEVKEPDATIVDTFTLRKTQLNILSNRADDNIKLLRDIPNEQDFNLIKGLLIEQAILQNKDYAEISKVKFTTQDDLKARAYSQLNQIANNPSKMIGLDPGLNMVIRKDGIEEYLNKIAGIQKNHFE